MASLHWYSSAVGVVLAACTVGVNLPELPERSRLPMLSAIDRAYEDVLAEPRNAALNGRLGLLIQREGAIEAAATLYQRAFVLAPREFRWPYLLAVAQLALDDYDSGSATLRHALTLREDYRPGQLRLARVTLRMGAYAECESLSSGLAQDPETQAWAEYLLGRTAAARDQHAAAIEHFRRACDRFPAFGAAHWRWGWSAAAAGDAAVSEDHFVLADRHKFSYPPIVDALAAEAGQDMVWAEPHLRDGYEAETSGRLEEAERRYRQALALDPRSDAAHARLVAVMSGLGRPAEAEVSFRRATQLNPQQDDAYAHYGGLLRLQNRFQEARAAFDQALRINPYHPEALNSLGEMLEQNGQPDAAESLYRKSAAARPDYREAQVNLGRLLVAGHRHPEAFRWFETAAAIEDPKAPALLYEMVSSYVRAGNRAKALECLKRARELAARFDQVDLLDRMERDPKVF